MAEYINREDALAFTHPDDWGTPDERWRPESEYGGYIQNIPAADVEDVVCCVDCVHFSNGYCTYENQPIIGDDATQFAPDLDYYCYFGKRKEG